MSADTTELEKLSAIAEVKERELQEVSKRRIEILEGSLKEKENMVNKERARFLKLREDFEFNVKLIQERDQELEQYEHLSDQLRHSYKLLEQQNSDLRIEIDKLKSKLSLSERAKEELASHYYKRTKELQRQIQVFQSSKQSEVDKERNQYVHYKNSAEKQLKEAKEEMDSQRRQMLMEFEEVIKAKDHQHRTNLDEKQTEIHTLELKVRMLEREKELMKECSTDYDTKLESCEGKIENLKRELKKKEWEMQDQRNMKEAKISDLVRKIQTYQREISKITAEFATKQGELNKHLNDRESIIKNLKESFANREKELLDSNQSLKAEMESKEINWKGLEWDFSDRLQEKQIANERLQQELESYQKKLTFSEDAASKDLVAKDLELESLRDIDCKLREDLQRKSEDLDRYKSNLKMALERERVLEQAKVQSELDWRKRCEEVERKVYQNQEEIMKNLTKANEEAHAQLKDKERQLNQQIELCMVLKRDRDDALSTLKKKGISLEVTQGLASIPESGELAEENRALKAAIQQMREDMESLSRELNESGHGRLSKRLEQAGAPLEVEVSRLNRVLEEKDKEISQLKESKEEFSQRIEVIKIVKAEFVNAQKKWSLERLRLLQRIEDLETTRDARKISEKAYAGDKNEQSFTAVTPQNDESKDNRANLKRMLHNESKVRNLQAQLRNAVKQIALLVKERDKLIQLGNKQRSESSRRGNPELSLEDTPVELRKGKNVEEQQYALTTQALRDGIHSTPLQQDHVEVILSKSTDSETELEAEEELTPEKETDVNEEVLALDAKPPRYQTEISPSSGLVETPLNLFSSSSNVTSLDEVWRLLDEQESLVIDTPVALKSPRGNRVYNQGSTNLLRQAESKEVPSKVLTVMGKQAALDKRPGFVKTSSKFTPKRSTKSGKKLIRNYNIRDDSKIT